MNSTLHQLEWDSEVWGFPVAQLDLDQENARNVTVQSLDSYRVVQALVELNNIEATRRLAALGFFPVDTRLEYSVSPSVKAPFAELD